MPLLKNKIRYITDKKLQNNIDYIVIDCSKRDALELNLYLNKFRNRYEVVYDVIRGFFRDKDIKMDEDLARIANLFIRGSIFVASSTLINCNKITKPLTHFRDLDYITRANLGRKCEEMIERGEGLHAIENYLYSMGVDLDADTRRGIELIIRQNSPFRRPDASVLR